MKKKIKYRNEKIGKVSVVKDFLPKPEDLAFKEDTVKVTLNLSKSRVEDISYSEQRWERSK